MSTLLFFDDFYLNRWENLTRHVGHPQLVPEATFEDPDHWLSSGYPTVFRGETGAWRCLYQGRSVAEPQVKYPLVAESGDGIEWETPDLSQTVPLPERRFRNQVLPMDEFGEWDCYWDERAENPEERLKGLVTNFHTKISVLWTSPDGLAWKKVEGVEWRPGSPDPPSTAFWNEVRQCYVVSARPVPPHPRRFALSETRDWRTFSEPELALMTDALDPPLTELYGMIVFPYEEKYIALLWLYHTDPYNMQKYWEGKTDCQLAYSYNGWHFQRTLREPFIPNAAPGEIGAGLVRPTTLIIDEKPNIRIYSSSSKLEHGYHLVGDDRGAIIMHRLRLDGFMYLQSNAGKGLLGTRPLIWRGGEVRLNVQSGNEVRVQVTDIEGRPMEGYGFADCPPFNGDELFWQPRWKNGKGLSELAGKALRLDISLNHARIYAIRGDLLPVTIREAVQFQESGEEPHRQPGF